MALGLAGALCVIALTDEAPLSDLAHGLGEAWVATTTGSAAAESFMSQIMVPGGDAIAFQRTPAPPVAGLRSAAPTSSGPF